MKTKVKTRKELIDEWDREAKVNRYLWEGAAISIRNTLRQHTLEAALPILQTNAKACRQMAIHVFYARAIRDVKAALKAKREQ
jgi:hypothetical protein